MKKSLLLGAVCACTLALITTTSNATVVLDFNDQAPATNFGSLTENGFTVNATVEPADGNHLLLVGGSSSCTPDCPNNGSNYLLTQGDDITISAISGGLFSLTQFDGAETHEGVTDLWSEIIQVVGTLGSGGTVTADFALDWFQDGDDAGVDFQTFALPPVFVDLSSVTFFGIDERPINVADYFSLDNIEVSAVPIPPALWLFGSGLLALIGMARRKP